MNGADSLVRTLIAGGVETCFANPGTSELHFVAALDGNPGIRSILCLFEGVATGAADGYARMCGRPAATLLHLGPGLANGLANLHNARRARVGMLNIVGDHATYHRRFDAPLTADIEALAGQFSAWLKTSTEAVSLGADTATAIAVASAAPTGAIATLILPADVAWGTGGAVGTVVPLPPLPPPDRLVVDEAASLLGRPGRSGILLGNGLAQGDVLEKAALVAAATGASLYTPFSFSRVERGAGRPIVQRLPYVLEQALAALADVQQMLLIGAPAPVAFFAYPGMPSKLLPPECASLALTEPGGNHMAALDALIERLGCSAIDVPRQEPSRPTLPSGPITLDGLARAVGALLLEGTIVVDESLTSGRGMMAATAGAPAHDWLVNSGGSIGIGLPLAVGAAVACPNRPVLCLQADGSAMYTPQALWTMAREQLNVTTVIFANRAYAILKGELAKFTPGPIGPEAASMLNLDRPAIDWVGIAGSLGVAARQVTHLVAFAEALQDGLAGSKPNLIEVML
jgi:acetolactate synthase-1/2/3 large subunit